MCVASVVASQNSPLVGGTSPCSRTTELNTDGQWWKRVEMAGDVCRELDCGAVLSTQISLTENLDYHRYWLFTLNCSGTEPVLHCDTKQSSRDSHYEND